MHKEGRICFTRAFLLASRATSNHGARWPADACLQPLLFVTCVYIFEWASCKDNSYCIRPHTNPI